MALSFGADRQQERVRELVREFVDRVVGPVAAELDRKVDPADCFSWEIVEQADEVGLRTLTLAPEWGGPGADSLTAAIVVEELARGDGGVAASLCHEFKDVQTIQDSCSEDQQARYLPAFRDDPRALLATAFTEPDSGSDQVLPYDVPYRTTATRVDGGWLLNGTKHFISNGGVASLTIVYAQTERDRSMVGGSTCFVVPHGAEGFTTGHVHDKLGLRLCHNAELVFRDCFVPDEDVVGAPGEAFDLRARTFAAATNAYGAAIALGIGEAIYEHSLEWARQRVQGGRPLIEHDVAASRLAEMRMQLDTARLYVYHAAWAADRRGTDWHPALAVYPKVVASRAATHAASSALELLGGYGYMREFAFEKLLRDAAAFPHFEGADDTLVLRAANLIRSGH